MDAKVYCLASAKGGSGKTIMTASLTAFLANVGKKCAAIDCDAATHGMTLLFLPEIAEQSNAKGRGLFDFPDGPETLEPISKSFKQYQQGCELHKAQEVVRIVLPARHNTALPLEPGKKALDLPPPRVAT